MNYQQNIDDDDEAPLSYYGADDQYNLKHSQSNYQLDEIVPDGDGSRMRREDSHDTLSDEAIARNFWNEDQQSVRLRSPVRQQYDDGQFGGVVSGKQLPDIPTSQRKVKQRPLIDINDASVRRQVNRRQNPRFRPWFIWTVSVVQVVLMIVAFVRNQQLTGELIQTSPFNILIGPSAFTLIRLGARFVPCMKNSTLNGQFFECPRGISSNGSTTCSLQDLCPLADGQQPDQWYRFIAPIFLHGGLLHILINFSFQLTTCTYLERVFGWYRIAPIYMLSGVFGFAFGGAFGIESNPSVGCSGALFGIVAVLLIDLLKNWRVLRKPWIELAKLLVMIIVSFALGLIPGVDNFSHIGGFFMGLFGSLAFLPSVSWKLTSQRNDDVGRNRTKWSWSKLSPFVRKSILFVIGMSMIVLFYVLIFRAFYGVQDAKQLCPACQYFGCLPIGNLCSIGTTT
ncbi:hypothetical protein MIR68_010824 [Amoeboaphelidium protococcarum]|nr:hypothetical protein MIR68_010824 [Amoeboaphelidium protococcarum]